MFASEFNYHLKRARFDECSLEVIYPYVILTVRKFIRARFGKSRQYDNLPHDIFTKLAIENVPDKYIDYPKAWLCKIAHNMIVSDRKLKDNNNLPLIENYCYYPNYDELIQFEDQAFKKMWDSIDKESQYILYLNVVHEFQLNEIAYFIEKKAAYVRTKKFRALKVLEKIELKKE